MNLQKKWRPSRDSMRVVLRRSSGAASDTLPPAAAQLPASGGRRLPGQVAWAKPNTLPLGPRSVFPCRRNLALHHGSARHAAAENPSLRRHLEWHGQALRESRRVALCMAWRVAVRCRRAATRPRVARPREAARWHVVARRMVALCDHSASASPRSGHTAAHAIAWELRVGVVSAAHHALDRVVSYRHVRSAAIEPLGLIELAYELRLRVRIRR
eukprot:CAMPEP_0183588832 /NCGR_PEP_ID=MMETSP0371-20130417/161569_1 /TAXON_ID=268820 /ORGANISM="Peridinium aciculiferum, Strain PAER-2" /LENGTH=213 /DNA_ID=CAMNT_0025800111 /DNA_START=129 /DNA_END=770 /DNA_ORIENTATION=-